MWGKEDKVEPRRHLASSEINIILILDMLYTKLLQD